MRWTLFLVALAGCVGDTTVVNDAGVDASKDAPPDTSNPSDGGGEAGDAGSTMCDPSTPFGAPTAVTELNAIGSGANVRLSSDYLAAYFSAGDAGATGNLDIFVGTRATATGPFGNIAPLTAVNTPVVEGSPTVTGDGLTLYLDRQVGNPIQILSTSRADTNQSFLVSPLEVGPPVDNDAGQYFDDSNPFVREDGQVLYFASNRISAQTYDIYRATRGDGGFTSAAAVNELNTTAREANPTVTPDDLVIYFSSTRAPDGGAESSDYDIFMATRASTSDQFGTPKHVAELATGGDDRPDFITRDRCALYFHRVSNGGTGLISTIYVATKTK